MDSRFDNYLSYMDNLKEEMELAQRRLCHERQEYQGHLEEVKLALQESMNSNEIQMNEVRYLKSWGNRLNEVLALQSMIEI